MSVPVSTAVEVHGQPKEYKSGQMNAMDGDGTRKVAFITGTTGQDGSYLVELLLQKGACPSRAISDPLGRRRRASRRDRSRASSAPISQRATFR
jgi:hypothetical protein